MFRYTKAAIDIVIGDITRYCNLFKFGTRIFTILYFIYALCVKSGNFIVNIVLLSLFSLYIVIDFMAKDKEFEGLKRFIRRGYKGLKFLTKTFNLGVMIYGVYNASINASPISIILATLMIIMWVLQILFEIVIEIFDTKKDLIVAGWNKDIENLKKPVSTVTNFIKKVKGEDIVEEESSNLKEIKILEKQITNKKKKTLVR